MKKIISLILVTIAVLMLNACAQKNMEIEYTDEVLELVVPDSVTVEEVTIHFYGQYKNIDDVIAYLKQDRAWEIDYVKEKFNLNAFSKSTAESYYIAITNILGPDQRLLEFQSIISTLECSEFNDRINRLLKEYEGYSKKEDVDGMKRTLQHLTQISAYHE